MIRGSKSWIQLSSTTRPPPRAYTSLTFDPVRGRRVLVGGYNFQPHGNWDCFADSWESDQSPGWEQVGNRIPPGTRSSSPMVYDAARDTIVLFGGSWECTGDNHTWGRRVTRINGSPSIVVQPEDARIPLGEGVSLRVDAVGEGTLTYQWRRNGQPIERDFSTRVFGENSAILSIVDAIIQDTGSYDVVVSNACTSVTSKAAMLTITGGCLGDFNTDGTLTSQDFFDFLTAFFDLLPRADIDKSGTVDSADFFIYLEAFFAGCE